VSDIRFSVRGDDEVTRRFGDGTHLFLVHVKPGIGFLLQAGFGLA
jgi:hypothetical protein